MSDFKDIPLSTFTECQEKLKYDDFIFTDNMNAFESMSALDVQKPKIDCHMMAKGAYTIKELLENGFYMPDENITNDEIRKICGYFLDVLEARLDGYTVYQSTLLCAYLHKEYEIKNPFLKTIIQSFAAISNSVEKFVDSVLTTSFSFWAYSETLEDVVQSYDISEVRESLKKFRNDDVKDIVDFCEFLLDFSDFLEKFPKDQNAAIPEVPELFEVSEKIGFSENMHLRDLTTRAPPTKLMIKDHKDAVEAFKKMFVEMKEIIAMPKPKTIVESIKQASDWSFNHQHSVMLVRIVRIGMALGFEHDKDYFYGENILDIFKREISEFHTAENIFSHQDFSSLAFNIRVFLLHLMRAIYFPAAYFCCMMSKNIFRLWGRIQESNINAEISLSHPKPKTSSVGTQQILKTTIFTWGEAIGAQLAIEYMRHYFIADCMINDDVPYIALVLSAAYNAIVDCYEKKRILDAIYSVYEHRRGSRNTSRPMSFSDIDKRRKPESQEELQAKGMSAIWDSTFFAAKHLLETKALKPKETMFYNPMKLYEDRYNVITKLPEIKIMNPQQYEYSMKQQTATIDLVKNKFESARSHVKKAIDDDVARAKEDDKYQAHPFNKLMAMNSIKSLSTILRVNDKHIKFEIDQNVLPEFNLVD